MSDSYYDIYNNTNPITVFEEEPKYTELLDKDGKRLVYSKQPIGFYLGRKR